MEQEVDEEIPMPLNTSVVGHNLIYHHHHQHTDHDHEKTANCFHDQEQESVNVVLYKECLKNHAASSGGNVIDGCGEFMPISTTDPFTCSACNCHRNFHRRLEFGPRRVVLGHHGTHQMIISYDNNNHGHQIVVPNNHGYDQHHHQKRFRTKFTQEQKERMVKFAEKVGWKIQKQEESVIQHFCQQIGVKRRVLKVWMHNNKHKYYSITNANANAIV